MPRLRASSSRIASSVGADAAVDVLFLAAVAGVTLAPVITNGFVNWDDPAVLIDNTRLSGGGILAWAFSTTLIGHFQPLAWLDWAVLVRLFGLAPRAFHSASLALHIVNGALVYALARSVLRRGAAEPLAQRIGAVGASLLFLLHPTGVEPVAWASAFPYVASLTPLLCATLAYLAGRRGLALICHVVSLLTRPIALGFPLVLLALDAYPLKRTRAVPLGRLLLEKVPFLVFSAAAALLEWRARDVAGLQELGAGARLTAAAAAPFVYAARFAWPVRLSPLDVLPISSAVRWLPLIAGLAALVAVSLVVWRVREKSSAPAAAWFTFLILLAPVAGLVQSGVQATADRYLYAPAVLCSLAVATVFALATPAWMRTGVVIAGSIALVALGTLARRQVGYWHDSIALWSRAVELDSRNDIALYNLAVALADQGRDEEAIARYQQTLAVVPEHDLARRELAKLQASRTERDADRLAATGRLDDAIEQYRRVLALDDRRLHARTALGIALVQRGRLAEAARELRRAVEGGARDVDSANALAYALVQTNHAADAIALLGRATADHPDDVNLKHNLARLLATADDAAVRDPRRSLQLAREVCERTGNRDPRALDTLALAYAANGERDAARATAARAAGLARELGDNDTAAAIAAHAAAFGR